MSEPLTNTQQIAAAVAAIWAEIARLTAALANRASWILTDALVTMGNTIRGGEDSQGEPYNLRFEAPVTEFDGIITAKALHENTLSCMLLSGDTLIDEVHTGRIIIVGAAAELTPDTALPAPESGHYWFCQILNTSTGNVVVKYPGVGTLNNGTSDINIGAGKAALLLKTGPTALRLIGGA